jgi:hypothetical protein
MKYLALKRFIKLTKPYVLLLQETMVSATKAREIIIKILPNWYSCGVNSNGLSGGLLSVWNPKKVDFNAYLTFARIMLEGIIKGLDKKLKLINCYGLYLDREVFWENIKREGLLK